MTEETSIIRLGPSNVETYELILRPKRVFISSSAAGVSQGEVSVFPDGSSVEKDVVIPQKFNATNLFGQSSESEVLIEQIKNKHAQQAAENKTKININSQVQKYMSVVNSQGSSQARSKKVEVMRFTPTFKFTSNTLRKNIIRETLTDYYRMTYPSVGWNYTNYNCLNFFTSSQTPTSHCLMYHASASVGTSVFPCRPSDAFTFEFYINPKYTTLPATGYKAGTIMHMSSCYAITLHTGSDVLETGEISNFRIALQLSHSADIPPSHLKFGKTGIQNVTASRHGVGKDQLVFVSRPKLKHNHWHHVALRWGNTSFNNSTGSIVIDGKVDGEFVLPLSKSIMPTSFKPSVTSDPDALILGNYFEGKNIGTTMIAKFFNDKAKEAHGVSSEFPGSALPLRPRGSFFHHPLNAEIHEIRIWNQHRTINQIISGSQRGLRGVTGSNEKLMFYVPPLFQKSSPKRKVFQTPFQMYSSTTDDPFNTALSFGVGGKEINIQNFTMDFARKVYPLPLSLTASQILGSSGLASANDHFAKNHEWNAGTLLIQPCDNGKFMPKFSLLISSSKLTETPSSGSIYDRFVDEFGNVDLSIIKLNDLMSTGSLPSIDGRAGPFVPTGSSDVSSLTDELQGANPEDPGRAPGSVLTVLNRTRDFSSNEVVFYDISNLYYGSKIEPESLVLIDEEITGSGKKMKMRIQDDGRGNIYRADAKTVHAKWNKIGNIFYDEGLITILSPNINFFGKHQTKLYFRGRQRLFVKELNIPVPAGMINSSSNRDWKKIPPTANASENSDSFVYVSSINIHDENLNVVARAHLAQPFAKRDAESFLVRLKLDF